jgi:hypothetical protein
MAKFYFKLSPVSFYTDQDVVTVTVVGRFEDYIAANFGNVNENLMIKVFKILVNFLFENVNMLLVILLSFCALKM